MRPVEGEPRLNIFSKLTLERIEDTDQQLLWRVAMPLAAFRSLMNTVTIHFRQVRRSLQALETDHRLLARQNLSLMALYFAEPSAHPKFTYLR